MCAGIVDLLSTGTDLPVGELVSILKVLAILLHVHIPGLLLQVIPGHDVKLQGYTANRTNLTELVRFAKTILQIF